MDLWIRYRHNIDLTLMSLLGKQRSFPDTDADAHLRAAHMIECRLNLCSFLLNQHVKIDIDIPAHGLVLRVSVKLSLLLLFVLAASLSTRRLHLLDVVHDVARRRHIILFHLWLLSKAIGYLCLVYCSID